MKMRGRRTGVRDLSPHSPTTKMKDKHSDWRQNPFPPRSRRSPSPSIRRSQPGRRSASLERRDYISRRPEHGKQQQQLPSPPSRNQLAPMDDENYKVQRKYLFSSHPINSKPEVNAGSKAPRAVKDVDFHHQGNVAPSPSDGQDVLVKKSMYLDDGSVRTFFTLPPDTSYLSDAAALNSSNPRNGGGNLNAGIRDNQVFRYHDRLKDPYDEIEMEKIYARDVPYPVEPPTRPRPFSGPSSSSLGKGDFLSLYSDRLHPPSDRFGKSSMSKFSDDPSDRNGYSQVQLSEQLRRRSVSPPARDKPWNYSYQEPSQKDGGDHGFLASNEIYKKMPYDPRGDYKDKLGSSFMDIAIDRVAEVDASRRKISESNFWDQRQPLHGDRVPGYRDMSGVHEDYAGGSGTGHLELGMRSSRDHERVPFGEGYAFGRDSGPVGYRGRPRSPLLSDHHFDMHRQVVSPPRGKSHTKDLGVYDPSSERMIKRKFVMDGDANETDMRSIFSNNRNASRRIEEPSGSGEFWSNEDRVGFLHSKRLTFGRSQQRMPSRRMSGSDARLQPGDSFTPAEGGRDMSLKKRLRPNPPEFHGSFFGDRRQDFHRPYKMRKRGLEDWHGGRNVHDGDVPDDDKLLVKTDPPEGSEEFKQQVHKAFLRFSKLLNENQHQQKRYREQGKASNLLCCVCGSLSKEFVDTHSLVAHSYHSLKVGLKTDHLGLHKALCVLMGWNWLMAPDNSRVYQSRPVAETKAVKEDLILWPPLVIIHNISIGNKNNSAGPNVVTNEGMEEILRGMGFGAGKTRVCRGKPANQSVLLVKFMPTFSGLQEAERLHKHFAEKNHGREEFKQSTSNRSSDGSEKVSAEKVDELLYGYMAIAEDLDKLDSETKKRSLVKSKKDIEAIADAPLNTD